MLVLGDVAPAAAELASQLGAPLVWMANFGWDAIYRPMGEAFIAWADRALAAYRQGSAVIRCPFAMAMPWGLPEHPVGLTAGQPRGDRELRRRQLDLPSERDAVVLVGFGGLGFPLEAALFARWPEHRFLVADPQRCERVVTVGIGLAAVIAMVIGFLPLPALAVPALSAVWALVL